jgi:hypothetical protein
MSALIETKELPLLGRHYHKAVLNQKTLLVAIELEKASVGHLTKRYGQNSAAVRDGQVGLYGHIGAEGDILYENGTGHKAHASNGLRCRYGGSRRW